MNNSKIMEEKNNSVDKHDEILKELHNIYIRKNDNYGDSFSRSFKKYGLVSAMVRMQDKRNRIDNLFNKFIGSNGVFWLDSNKKLIDNEALEDTMLDLANYLIMTVMEMRNYN